MKLTSFTDYSLRVLIFVAAQPTRRATIGEIAATFEISEHHLTKVAHFLGKAGWLANVRGKGGGLELAMPPELINIGEVVRATEGDARPAECFVVGGNHCRIAGICSLSDILADAVAAFYGALDRFTLAELVRNRQALAKVLFTEHPVAAPRSRTHA